MIQLPNRENYFLLTDEQCCQIAKKENASQYLGGKVTGLCDLPSYLVPKYFVIAPAIPSVRGLQQYDNENNYNIFQKFLKKLQLQKSKIYIRSSAKNEFITERGKFRSEFTNPSLTQLYSTLQDLLCNPVESHSVQKENHNNQLAYLIQQYIDWHAKGHLSNERRISKDAKQWRIEYQFHQKFKKNDQAQWITTTQGGTNYIDPTCPNQSRLVSALTTIAAFHFDKPGQRYHFEWVWDSKRIWIVQKDTELYSVSGRKPSVVSTEMSTKPINKTKVFCLYRFNNKTCPKLDALNTFHKCNLPSVTYYYLNNNECLRELCSGKCPPPLQDDLKLLIKQPLVIRTDVQEKASGLPPILLPRSNLLRTYQDAINFLTEASRQLASAGTRLENINFIAHHYIPAVSSALAFATPCSQKVLVHASWGMPDGLFYQGYDSYVAQVNERQPRIIEKNIKHKGEYINIGESGQWTQFKVAPPWDWKPSIREKDALDISQYTHKVASYLNKPVTVMFLVDLPKHEQLGNVLPWFYSIMDDWGNSLKPSRDQHYNRTLIKISKTSDLQKIQNLSNTYVNNCAILLKPNENLLRSITFLNDFSEIVKENALEVFIEGSYLSHVYYILKRNSVTVHLLT